MSVTQEQIEKLANNLSKISTKNDKIGTDVNEILKYIELLNEVDTTGIVGTISVVDKENTLREDTLSSDEKATPEELLKCSPQKIISKQIAISNIMK